MTKLSRGVLSICIGDMNELMMQCVKPECIRLTPEQEMAQLQKTKECIDKVIHIETNNLQNNEEEV